MISCLSFKHKVPEGATVIDCTSRSLTWGKEFSPFFLGPVELYDGYVAQNLENGYQFAKVYPIHNFDEWPDASYYEWAKEGWNNKKPIKYPFGAWNECLYHWWAGKKLNRLEAQNTIFLPLFKKAVMKTEAFKKLKELYDKNENVVLLDFEGYNHRFMELDWAGVANHPSWAVGQGFGLCMILEGYL